MATLTAFKVFSGNGSKTVSPATLATSDNFKVTGSAQELVLHNPTGGSLTANLLGDQATSDIADSRFGEGVDVSAGYNVVVPAGETRSVAVQSISAYLKDSENLPDITGADGMEVTLFEQ